MRLSEVLSNYAEAYQPTAVQELGNAGGFSGASLWRLATPAGTLCLRRWPESHPTIQRLEFIHRVLSLASQQGCDFIPNPIRDIANRTFVTDPANRHWELTAWMPGTPLLSGSHLSRIATNNTAVAKPVAATDGDAAALNRIQEAMACLARFHRAAAADDLTEVSQSPGLQHRLQFANELCDGQLVELQGRLKGPVRSPFQDQLLTISQLAAPMVATLPPLLDRLAHQQLPLQPCIRDIWSDHVLFEDETVTGIVDFGAMQTECVAGDIARLLGSIGPHLGAASSIESMWSLGLEAYCNVRPLTDLEHRAVSCFHQATTVLAGFNWIRWLMVEDTEFGNGVRQRLDAIITGLRSQS